jgi:signal transduction histidine kinase
VTTEPAEENFATSHARRPASRGRLFWRVYLHGLLLLVLVALALAGVGAAFGPPSMRPGLGSRMAAWAALHATEARREPAALMAELERARDVLGIEATVWSAAGVVATNVDPPLPALGLADRVRLEGGPIKLPAQRAFAAKLGGSPPAYLVVTGGPVPFPWARVLTAAGVLLVVLALASVPLARAIASPVERLTHAVEAFGAGDLSARARVQAPGEVGQLARSFDEMAERIERLLRAERELLANVSHELRTPLARIRVALEIAAEGDAERARRTLGEIGGDLAELESIVDDVLTAARLEAGTAAFPLRREPVAPEELVRRAAERFRGAHPDRPLEIAEAADLPLLDADPMLLRRALDNVLENADRYSAPGLPVSLALDGSSTGIRVRVADRGIGITPDELPRLFTPFFRSERGRAHAKAGTGLGLALAKQIVEAHAGTISVESTPGRGTRFTIELPPSTMV